ncbi:hypothetical protein DICPUDRAFT_44441, partial [Dictyostelium purpureum]
TVNSLQLGSFDHPLSESIVLSNGTLLLEPVLPNIGLKYLDLGGLFNQTIYPGVLPQTLTSLKLSNYFNQHLIVGSLPDGIKHLKMGILFNKKLIKGVLPSKLEHLELSIHYNQPIDENGILPSGLKVLVFDLFSQYDHPIEAGVFPDSLTDLKLGQDFNQSLENLPKSIKKLTICEYLDQDYFPTIPESVEDLRLFEFSDNSVLDEEWHSGLDALKSLEISERQTLLSIPSSITRLKGFTILEESNQSYRDQLSLLHSITNLKELSVFIPHHKTLQEFEIPKQIEFLKFEALSSQLFTRTLQHCYQLHTLIFSFEYKMPILPNSLPDSLTTLVLSPNQNIPFEKDALPSGLKNLSIKGYDIPLESSHFSQSIKLLEFGYDCTQTLTENNLPPEIETLIIWGFKTKIQLPLPKTLKTIYLFSGNQTILENIELFNTLLPVIRVLNSNLLSKIFDKQCK